MKKIQVTEDGKQLEAFVKLIISEKNDKNERIIHGVSMAGTNTASRAVHAAMYTSHHLEIIDDDTNKKETVLTTQQYRRIEHIDGKVNHTFAMPRSSVAEDYKELVINNVKNQNKYMPERIVVAPKGDINEVVGNFLAETFGLPKLPSWRDLYLTIFVGEKIKKLDIETTKLAGEWKHAKAVKIKSMSEEEVLKRINDAIAKGHLKTKNTSIMGEGNFHEGMTTSEYLKKNAEIIAKKIDAHMKPIYDGTHYLPYLGETERICLPAQAKAVMSAYEVLKQKQGVFVVGDMGTGKTQISLSTVYTYARNREVTGAKNGTSCLIVAPSNVLPKWATSEIPKTLGKKRVTVKVIRNTEDALAYVRRVKSGYKVPKGKIEFVLVSTDRMKFAAQGYVLGAKWNPYHFHWTSPNTGKPLVTPKIKQGDKEEDMIAGWSDVVSKPSKPPTLAQIEKAREDGTLGHNGLPIGYIKKWKDSIRAFQDDYKKDSKKDCSLARPALKKLAEGNGKPRWMIAEIFQRHLRNHFHIGIYDEVHKMKASDSGRGVAFGRIIKSSRKSIFLTGTLTNGSSSSIKDILWRAFPRELIAAGINHLTSNEQWATRYGVLEKIRTNHDETMTVGKNSNRKRDSVVVRERAGIAPSLVANFLLDKSIFVDLVELQVPLVDLHEEPIIVELDEDHLEEYKSLHGELFSTATVMQKRLGSAAWAKFNPTTINYVDQPNLGAFVEYEDGDEIISVQAPAFPDDYINAKERRLIKMVHSELAQDRKSVIFTNYTGEYKQNERLQEVLAKHGISSQILNGNVPTHARFDWLEQQAKKGTQVIITNMKLVEVGLDLMEYPSLHFYQMNDDINTVRQASRRSWRLGQHRLCKVFYYVAKKTQQMAQFERLMSRRVSALIVEGRIERSDELAKYADMSVSGLTSDLSKSLESTEVANAWKQVAAKDVDSNIEIVSEEEFQQKVSDAFARLTQETIKLSGYVPPAVDEIKKEEPVSELSFDDLDVDAIEEAFALFDQLNAEKIEEIFDEIDEKEQKEIDMVDKKRREKRLEEMDKENVDSTEQLDLFAI
ncbi:helicase-related protein [Cytobacillus sp. IB215665]|uniref:helicase-related protein n=1 Tax=Cytobacillus sp. IB215665 TaxID=3097357 RepID=UPI002A10569E|nr:helicase-related protein [Cytobacillus sp. IB215665]MDX8367702.1 helicase-related protein [Cytobacillus sp. IB215665]